MQIKSIEFIFGANESAEDLEDESDRYSDRQIIVSVQTVYGVETVKIVPCYGGYEQYGSFLEVIRLTSSIAQKLNSWLHGGDLCTAISE